MMSDLIPGGGGFKFTVKDTCQEKINFNNHSAVCDGRMRKKEIQIKGPTAAKGLLVFSAFLSFLK